MWKKKWLLSPCFKWQMEIMMVINYTTALLCVVCVWLMVTGVYGGRTKAVFTTSIVKTQILLKILVRYSRCCHIVSSFDRLWSWYDTHIIHSNRSLTISKERFQWILINHLLWWIWVSLCPFRGEIGAEWNSLGPFFSIITNGEFQ